LHSDFHHQQQQQQQAASSNCHDEKAALSLMNRSSVCNLFKLQQPLFIINDRMNASERESELRACMSKKKIPSAYLMLVMFESFILECS
jgi:hypothetical protein